MSNVIPIGLPRRPNLSQRQALMLRNFALNRRAATDVYWLKENAELLGVLSATGARLDPADLAPLSGFYAGLEDRMRFFPQYYRFLLSLCLDLEDLGMEGDTGRTLCHMVAENGLASAELSDLQRAEARYLLSRRDVILETPGLDDRLDDFTRQSDGFALPNKKAAYELTHIVFYRSGYGRRDIAADEALATSLEFAGLLAFLDQDVDLLAEICIAMRFAGLRPSEIWEDWLGVQSGVFFLEHAGAAAGPDAYHEYLVTNWWSLLCNGTGFAGVRQEGAVSILRKGARIGPLRAMSECMYQMGADRTGDWPRMRRAIGSALCADAHDILDGAERSSARFGDFFREFARTDR